MRRSSLRTTGLAVFLALVWPGLAASQAMTTCAVSDLRGPSARIWVAGQWSALGPGDAVPRDAKIVTDAETRVRIVCEDGLAVTVGTATEVNIESLTETGRGRVSQLIQGVLGIFGGGGRTGLEVRTPVLIASVRSTRWTVEQSAAEGGAVFVREGRVRVVGQDGPSVTLAPGLGVTVSAEGASGEVKTWGAARIARTMAALGFDWE